MGTDSFGLSVLFLFLFLFLFIFLLFQSGRTMRTPYRRNMRARGRSRRMSQGQAGGHSRACSATASTALFGTTRTTLWTAGARCEHELELNARALFPLLLTSVLADGMSNIVA
jgi:hypothetical protein